MLRVFWDFVEMADCELSQIICVYEEMVIWTNASIYETN